MKTKGQVEEAIRDMHLQNLVIYKPGLITERENDFRFGEKFAGYIPCISRISSAQLAKAILTHA